MRTHRSRLLGAAIILVAAIGATAVGSVASAAPGGNTKKMLNEQLTGYAEQPLALSTGASGQFQARIDDDQQTITYSLTYSGLTGSVTQAHIHFGSASQVGGISVFLCSNLGNGPAGTQACPPSGTITGTITPANVIGPAGQGISAGEFDEVVAAIRNGTAYVNVHSTQFPIGEIRAQFQHTS
jgi:CHRD domain